MTYANSSEPDQARQCVRPDLDLNLFDTLMVFLKDIFSKKKVIIQKKKSADDDKHASTHARMQGDIPVCIRYILDTTVKPALSGHSKIDKTKMFMTNVSLMKVERIAECSLWSILQYF